MGALIGIFKASILIFAQSRKEGGRRDSILVSGQPLLFTVPGLKQGRGRGHVELAGFASK